MKLKIRDEFSFFNNTIAILGGVGVGMGLLLLGDGHIGGLLGIAGGAFGAFTTFFDEAEEAGSEPDKNS